MLENKLFKNANGVFLADLTFQVFGLKAASSSIVDYRQIHEYRTAEVKDAQPKNNKNVIT